MTGAATRAGRTPGAAASSRAPANEATMVEVCTWQRSCDGTASSSTEPICGQTLTSEARACMTAWRLCHMHFYSSAVS